MPGRRSEQPDLRSYIPVFALPYWDGLLDTFVVDVIARCEGHIPRTSAAMYAAVTPLALWAYQVRGDEMTIERVFRGATIEEFVQRGMNGYLPGSRATIRSTLWRILEVVAPEEALRKRHPIKRSEPTRPYSDHEVAELYGWANGQRTKHRRLDALALLSLGIGAGLSTKEILSTTESDALLEGTGRLVVHVRGNRAREVPVLEEWRSALALVIADRPEVLLFRPLRQSASEGQVTDFILRGRASHDIRPLRMRTTFLVHHLELGTDPSHLLRISGLHTFAALDRLKQFHSSNDESTERLRGGHSPSRYVDPTLKPRSEVR